LASRAAAAGPPRGRRRPPDAHPLHYPNPGGGPQIAFDTAPSAVSKPFASEELQRLLAFHPASHYAVESEVATNAPYGDKFAVTSRVTLVARGPGRCVLHAVYALAFSPALSRMLRPMIVMGVDGGRAGAAVRGGEGPARRARGAAGRG
jgi:hypothetical protein